MKKSIHNDYNKILTDFYMGDEKAGILQSINIKHDYSVLFSRCIFFVLFIPCVLNVCIYI